MTNEKVMVLSFGLMDVSILELGKQVNSTAKVPTLAKTLFRSKVSGKMEEKSDGYKMMVWTMMSTTRTIDLIYFLAI